MIELFRREAFQGFGPCGLDTPGQERPTRAMRARRGRRLRLAVRKHCPRLPGVYGMVDANGDLIYVGKAKSLRTRLMGYFRKGSRKEKSGKIIHDTRRLVWEIAPNEFSALLRELELIRRFQPRFNVQGQPKRMRRCYLCIGRKPAAYAYIVTKPPARSVACFGPLAGLGRSREAARRLNDWYRLRDCPQAQTMTFADQSELFPVVHSPGCIRHEIGSCLAPCAAACSKGDYDFHVEAALDFLCGRDQTPLEQLERQMNEASVALEFERAVVLRDRLKVMTWLYRQLERLRQAIQLSFIYPVTSHDEKEHWYLIRHGLVRAVLEAPTDEASRTNARNRVEQIYSTGVSGMPGLEEVDGVLLVDGWFRKHREEKQRTLTLDEVRARLG